MWQWGQSDNLSPHSSENLPALSFIYGWLGSFTKSADIDGTIDLNSRISSSFSLSPFGWSRSVRGTKSRGSSSLLRLSSISSEKVDGYLGHLFSVVRGILNCGWERYWLYGPRFLSPGFGRRSESSYIWIFRHFVLTRNTADIHRYFSRPSDWVYIRDVVQPQVAGEIELCSLVLRLVKGFVFEIPQGILSVLEW